MWTAENGVPVKFSVGEFIIGGGKKAVGANLGHCAQSNNWEIVLTINQQPNNMIRSLRKISQYVTQ